MFFRRPGDQRIHSLPSSWTDVEDPDPFVALSAGRSPFRVCDLIALAAVIEELGRPAV